MKISTKLYFSFWSAMALVITIGVLIIFQIHTFFTLTVKLHNHPVSLNNSVYELNFKIVQIQTQLKETILQKDRANLEIIKQIVGASEKEMYQNFKVMQENFIGDNKLFAEIIKLLNKWKNTVDEIVLLQKQEQIDQVDYLLVKEKSLERIEELELIVKELMQIIKKQTNTFLEDTNFQAMTTLRISILLLILIIIGVWIIFAFLRNIGRNVDFGLEVVDALSKGQLNQEIKCNNNTEAQDLLKVLDNMQMELNQQIQKVTLVEHELDKTCPIIYETEQKLNKITQEQISKVVLKLHQ
ncbi:MAG: hypothetical protein KAH84_01070 [Thiomargarita sp.]|nr:hypothetical protein [Thiomargarita sp.]